MISLKNYPGSKNASGVYQRIISIMPKHDIYLEPFLGSGAILKNKDAARLQIGYDLDRSVINIFNDAGHGIATPGDSLIFLDTAATLLNGIHEQFANILIYCDPPYLIETRRSNSRIYKHEFTKDHHIKFLDRVRILKCYVMISCYDNNLYSKALKDWNKINIATTTRKGPATETVYYNFPDNLPKHQYTFMGSNFRDRAAIKGRVFRNASKILKMPAGEREYLMRILSEKIKMTARELKTQSE